LTKNRKKNEEVFSSFFLFFVFLDLSLFEFKKYLIVLFEQKKRREKEDKKKEKKKKRYKKEKKGMHKKEMGLWYRP
jgi:hypothetical protein